MLGGWFSFNWKSPRDWFAVVAILLTALVVDWKHTLGWMLFVGALVGAGLGAGWLLWGGA